LTGGDPVDLQQDETANGLIHVSALSLTKVADSLIDPNLVPTWLLSALGAPGFIIGALVPVPEAGSLLPQLILARRVEQLAQRKGIWAMGAAMQGPADLHPQKDAAPCTNGRFGEAALRPGVICGMAGKGRTRRLDRKGGEPPFAAPAN
jgi:hypothetical protein